MRHVEFPARREVIMAWSSCFAVLRCLRAVVGIVYYYQKASMTCSSQNLNRRLASIDQEGRTRKVVSYYLTAPCPKLIFRIISEFVFGEITRSSQSLVFAESARLP
jgi:hypothetical protein